LNQEIIFEKIITRASGIAQVVGHLPSKHEALNSDTNTTHTHTHAQRQNKTQGLRNSSLKRAIIKKLLPGSLIFILLPSSLIFILEVHLG
jgi:hypothetical protein